MAAISAFSTFTASISAGSAQATTASIAFS
jgi:hypothetical protein